MFCTQAVVLAKDPRDEAGVLSTMYTRAYGKVRPLAQGARKENAKLRGHLEPLQLSEICLVPAKRGCRLVHAKLVDSWQGTRSHGACLLSAWRMARVIDEACFEGERDERLWEFVVESFSFLDRAAQSGNPAELFSIFAERFELQLTNYIQHGSALTPDNSSSPSNYLTSDLSPHGKT